MTIRYVRPGTVILFGVLAWLETAQVPLRAAYIENASYETRCAEMDNVNIPVWAPGASHVRILATNPRYHPASINEWGADWEDCAFSSDRNLWIIGNVDGQFSEFLPAGFTSGDTFFAPDNPPAGLDELATNMPREINHDWMSDQYFRFTADENNDVNIEARIGAVLTVQMALISGTLEIEARAMTTNGWLSLGRRVFNSANMIHSWNVPDHTWIEGVDSNLLHLHVVPVSEGGQSVPGSWAYYDYLQLRRRDEQGDNSSSPTVLYSDSNTIVEAVWIDFWWRNPRAMRIVVQGGGSIETSQYLRIKRRMPDHAGWNEVFVLYEDGNARIIPYPPEGIGAVPYGASVILGPTTNGPRPAAGVDEVVVDPVHLTLRLIYESGGFADVALRPHRDGHYVDFYNIGYDTTNFAVIRFRSMWVYDGKSDIDHVACAQGCFPILHHWTQLEGTWWEFIKNVPSYHNTYCPEFLVELVDTNIGVVHREAEVYDSTEGGTIESSRTHAHAGQTLRFDAGGGWAEYEWTTTTNMQSVYMLLRYSDTEGGDGIDTWGNLVRIILDGIRTTEVYSVATGDWNAFGLMPRISLGLITSGVHRIRIEAESDANGIELDSFTLVSQPNRDWVPRTLVVQQAENYAWATNAVVAWRGSAVNGLSIHLEAGGEPPSLGFFVPTSNVYSHVYMRLRYADDVGPNRVRVYLNGQLRAQYPTLDTGWGWDSFTDAPPLYLGMLPAGTNLVMITSSLETWGVDIDEFELYAYDNHPPGFEMDSFFSLPVGLSTTIMVYASDPDGDSISLANPLHPAGSVFTGTTLSWTAPVERCGSSNVVLFSANDGRGMTNSVSEHWTVIVVPYDHDHDGLGDDWEWSAFGAYGYQASDDPDGDAADNHHEWVAGTDPMNVTEAFAAVIPDTEVAPGVRRIAVPTKPNRRYTIYYCDTLPSSGADWHTFSSPARGVWVETNTVESSHIFIDDESAETTGGAPASGRRYYRVKVEKIP